MSDVLPLQGIVFLDSTDRLDDAVFPFILFKSLTAAALLREEQLLALEINDWTKRLEINAAIAL